MSSTTKSNQGGENLFSTSLEKELLELELLAADKCCSDTVTQQAKSVCEEELPPPDDSALRCPPVFSKDEPEPLKAPSFPVKEKENALSEEPGKKDASTEEPKGIQLLEVEENDENLTRPFVNEQGTERLIEELKEVCKIAADSLLSQEFEREEQTEEAEEDQKQSFKVEKSDSLPKKQDQTASKSLLEELETLQILSEIDDKKEEKASDSPVEETKEVEQGSASANFLQELDTLSQAGSKKPDKKKARKKNRKNKAWTRKKKIVVASVIAGVFVFLIVLFQFVGFAVIDGASMTPSLSEHDFIIYWKHPGEITREEVILSRAAGYQNQIIAKRVIGLPGDIVEVDSQGKVLLNGEPYNETKAIYGEAQIAGDVLFPIEVGQNRYFVLGDNRAVSVDSRVSMVGQIAEKDILGEVICWFHIE